MTAHQDQTLFEKYDIPVPRYTSYPPVPSWRGDMSTDRWIGYLKQSMQKPDLSWSIYLHLPFCENQCTFCACNNIITRDHTKEDQYIQAMHTELGLYLRDVPEITQREIRQIHLGGGSPTFFQAENLKRLMEPFFANLKFNFAAFDGSVEVDPRKCNREQLQVLRDFGFNRVSLGVQDFDLDVQTFVNRVQPFEMVQACVENARDLGYGSVNFDLIYGLPGQTEESIFQTAKATVRLRPDRIALYSLAVVPWLKPAQNRFQKMTIRKGYEKRKLFEVVREVLFEAGYEALGIDHFALPADAITVSRQKNEMHRNFMGYTEYSTDVLLGMGVSAISDTEFGFHQNHKTIDAYYKALEGGILPTAKGHVLSGEDKRVQRYILNLMTNHKTDFEHGAISAEAFKDMRDEGLLEFDRDTLVVTERGVPFTRHICQRIDEYSPAPNQGARFSSGV